MAAYPKNGNVCVNAAPLCVVTTPKHRKTLCSNKVVLTS